MMEILHDLLYTKAPRNYGSIQYMGPCRISIINSWSLRQVVGTSGSLEKRCVDMLRADDWELLELQKEKLLQMAKDRAAKMIRVIQESNYSISRSIVA